MAVDNRPFKSKEQDGQGNEVIIRDQQLVEQGTTTAMPAGTYFQTLDVDGRPVKIPRDNMMNIVLECIGIILNDSSRNLGTNVQKALGLQGNTVGHSTVADFASVLGACVAIPNSADLNNYKEPGTYSFQGNNVSNAPSSTYSCIMKVYKMSEILWQEIYTTEQGHKYIRSYMTGTSTWSIWYRNDNYGTTSLAELASALGMVTFDNTNFLLGKKGNTTDTVSINSYTTPGIYGFGGMAYVTDLPTSSEKNKAHVLFVFPCSNNVGQVLIDIESSGGHIFGRYQITANWVTVK